MINVVSCSYTIKLHFVVQVKLYTYSVPQKYDILN